MLNIPKLAEIKVGQLQLLYGAKSDRFFKRMPISRAPWRMERKFYPRSQPSFSLVNEPWGTEHNSDGRFVVPVTASRSIVELDSVQLEGWWNLLHNESSKWVDDITNGLTHALQVELKESVEFLTGISDFKAINSLTAELVELGDIACLASQMCVLKRIFLDNADGNILCYYGFACSWAVEHEVNLVYLNDKFVRHEQGR
jgi:hypothetical protein